MVDVARYFIKFLVDESLWQVCAVSRGQPADAGDPRAHLRWRGSASDIELLERLSKNMMRGSLCALGQTAPNPVVSTLRYFRDEYEAHINERRCPGASCRKLITYTVNDKCNGCTLCLRVCPQKAISGEKKEAHVIDTDKCDMCGICFQTCKFDAIDVA